MRAFDQGGIQRDDFEQPAQAELFPEEELRNRQFWQCECGIDEKFARVVAGFAMDIEGAGIVRRECVVVPEVIGEPCIRRGDGDEIPGAFSGDAGSPRCLRDADLIDTRRFSASSRQNSVYSHQ